MLKTRLAEKDAQLMGGFGALSNIQFGGTGGGLPDPETIAATLPEQARLQSQKLLLLTASQDRSNCVCTARIACTLHPVG